MRLLFGSYWFLFDVEFLSNNFSLFKTLVLSTGCIKIGTKYMPLQKKKNSWRIIDKLTQNINQNFPIPAKKNMSPLNMRGKVTFRRTLLN